MFRNEEITYKYLLNEKIISDRFFISQIEDFKKKFSKKRLHFLPENQKVICYTFLFCDIFWI